MPRSITKSFNHSDRRPLLTGDPAAPAALETLLAQQGANAPAPTVGCILMASGQGVRFGGNKLLADFCGAPLIGQALAATDSVLFSRRIVVTRHPPIAALCKDRNIEVVLHAQPYRSDTVRIGLEAFGANLPDGCLFCPCDQPLLTRQTVERLVAAFAARPDVIHRLCWQGTPGSPLIFPKAYYPSLKNLPQGKGGAYILKTTNAPVRFVQAASPLELQDADTPEELRRLEQQRDGHVAK